MRLPHQHAVILWRDTLVDANVFLVPDVLSAAAEPHRRRLLQLLASGPRTVNELAGHFPVTRSAISQHLGVLEDAGLVRTERSGRYKFHHLDTTPLHEIAERWPLPRKEQDR